MSEQASPQLPDEEYLGIAAGIASGMFGRPEGAPTPESQILPEYVREKGEFHAETEEAVRQAYETGEEDVFVIMADLERFKSVNDDLGHPIGDAVIVDIKGLQSALVRAFRVTDTDERPADIIGAGPITSDDTNPADDLGVRLMKPILAGHGGGDEFLNLAHTDEAGAKAIVERWRAIFDDYINLPEHAALKQLGIGLSIGIGKLPPLDGPLTDEAVKEGKSKMLRAADVAMYQNKIDNMPWLDDDTKRDLRTIDFLMNQVSDRLGAENGQTFRLREAQKLLEKMAIQDQIDQQANLESEA